MISPSHAPLLTDFGVSHLLFTIATVRDPTGVSGTARWMAPELLTAAESDEKEMRKNSDIWSLGMVYLVRITLDLPVYREC